MVAPKFRRPPDEDLTARLRLGEQVRLMIDLPPKVRVVRAGTIGFVKNITGPDGTPGRYRVQFKVPGEYTTTITIENVTREQLSIVPLPEA